MNRMLQSLLCVTLVGLGFWSEEPVRGQDASLETAQVRCERCGKPVKLWAKHHCDDSVTRAGAQQLVPQGKASPQSLGTPAPMGVSGMTTPLPEPSATEPFVQGAPQAGMAPAYPGAAGQAPEAAAPGMPGAAAATPGTAAPSEFAAPSEAVGLGGGLSGPAGALEMIGDQGPNFGLRPPVPPPPSPPGPPGPPRPRPFGFQTASKGEEMLPWIRGFKIADNMSPVPQDRIYSSFNYFNQVNYAVNGRIGAPLSDLQIYRYQLGLEKTFLNGNASIGIRDGLNTLSANSPLPGVGGTHTAVGDLTVYTKFVLWQQWDQPGEAASVGYPGSLSLNRPASGGLISGGLAVTVPTGPSGFAGAPFSKSFHNTQLQPFLGYFWSHGRAYLQGFEAINVPTDPNDVTMLFSDVGAGYFYYMSPRPESFLSAAAATFEVHVNDPLNHRHPFAINDLAGTADVVDLTYGTNIFFKKRSLLSLAVVTPVSGPRAFNFEAVALFNIYFGGSRGSRSMAGPPVQGN